MTTASDLFLAPGDASIQRCARCGATCGALDASPACPSCGGLLDIVHAPPCDAKGQTLDAATLRAGFSQHCCARPLGSPSGVWRFESLVMPGAGSAIVSHPEGNTPLITRGTIDRFVGVEGLRVKHEGHNPTGSFKDRGMTVGVTQAVRLGATAVACASTGNTSASLASYAAQAGIPGLVFVPAGKIALGKLAQTLGYGARTLMVRGDFDACLRLVQEAARDLGIYLLNSINPWRVEGQKTIVLELLQQLDWQAPDFIVLPAGNLGNTAAFGKALREALALGLIDRLPRLVAVQAAGAAPFARSFREGFATRHTVVADTIATAIRIGDPASWDRAVRAIRETNGMVLSCTDEEIVAAKITIDASGVGCEPASAASIAGVRRLVQDGVITSAHRVVAVLTGHILKDPGMLVDLHQRDDFALANRPIEIDADVRAVARVLAHLTPAGPSA
ncbi:MAG: threonine synthase [Gemmatimonadaceae bacterium]|nr:threonine synthase [Gemmatimonadaceae bacterium]